MSRKPRILVLGKTLPLHDRASGDYRLFRFLEILVRGGFEVDFLSTTQTAIHKSSGKVEYFVRDSIFPSHKLELIDSRYISDLETIGVNPLNKKEIAPFAVRSAARYDIRPFLKESSYDLVWIEFYYLAEEYVDDIRCLQPQARVICDSVDLHFRRLARECNFNEANARYLVNSRQEKRKIGKRYRQHLIDQRRHADYVREAEIRAYLKCDAVAMVSEDDHQELARHCPSLPLLRVPNIHKRPTVAATEIPLRERSGCLFVGNFDHSPNLSSCVFLKHEVAPLLEQEAIPFQIVGSNPPKLIRTMAEQGPCADRFHVTGWVPSTSPFLNAARVSVAPILYGAGMNGKIGEAMCAGLPVVTTSLGALGMDLQHEKNCLIADAPEAFARAILRLHSDEELWHRLSKNGLEHVEKLYAENGLEAIILSALRAQLPDTGARAVRPKTRPDLALPPPKFSNPTTKPKFSVIVLAHNQWKFTELCLRSLSHAELSHPHLAEYILVDNASTDGTPQCAEQIPGLRVIRNQENLGFAAGNNRGMELARGENLILLNNDTIVPPAWLKQLLHHVESIPRLGILGPSTNTESGQNLPGFTYGSIGEFFEKNIALQSFEPGAWERVRKISGLCMVIPRKSYEKLGPLDPDFGLGYFEDDDLCLRAEDLGLTVARAKDLFVHHFGSVSFGAMEKKRLRVLEYGMAQFAFKWGKRGLDHIAREHKETILRPRTAKTVSC